MNYRKTPQLFVAKPKRYMSDYVDLTMPRRDWSKLDSPACGRLTPRSIEAQLFGVQLP